MAAQVAIDEGAGRRGVRRREVHAVVEALVELAELQEQRAELLAGLGDLAEVEELLEERVAHPDGAGVLGRQEVGRPFDRSGVGEAIAEARAEGISAQRSAA